MHLSFGFQKFQIIDFDITMVLKNNQRIGKKTIDSLWIFS